LFHSSAGEMKLHELGPIPTWLSLTCFYNLDFCAFFIPAAVELATCVMYSSSVVNINQTESYQVK